MLDKHDSRITAAAGKTKWDRVRNVTITELKQKLLVDQPRQILGARLIGKRGRGCPRKTWEAVIEELGRQRVKLAKDRKGFSRWTEDADTGL
jgi:hypothetical protein